MNSLKPLLSKLSPEELDVLHKIINSKDASITEIISKYGKLTLPFGGVLQEKLSYESILDKIAKKNNIKLTNTNPLFEKEKELFQKLFILEYENLSEEEKEEFVKGLEEKGLDQKQIASITSLAAISAAQLSGFGIYLLASSTVGAITSVLGVTLPFAFYSGMSSVISVVIGPIGFLVLGYGLYRSFRHIKSLDEAADIFKQSGKAIKNFFVGNLEQAEMAFKFITSVKILRVKNLEESMQKYIESNKEFEIQKNELNSKKNEAEKQIDKIQNEIAELQKQILPKRTVQDNLRTELDRIAKETSQITFKEIPIQNKINEYLKELESYKN